MRKEEEEEEEEAKAVAIQMLGVIVFVVVLCIVYLLPGKVDSYTVPTHLPFLHVFLTSLLFFVPLIHASV